MRTGQLYDRSVITVSLGDGVLQTPLALFDSLQTIADQLGTDSALSLSTEAVGITAGAADAVPLTVTLAESHTENGFVVEDNDGSTLFYVDKYGGGHFGAHSEFSTHATSSKWGLLGTASGGLSIASGCGVKWSSTSSYNGTPDLVVDRHDSGGGIYLDVSTGAGVRASSFAVPNGHRFYDASATRLTLQIAGVDKYKIEAGSFRHADGYWELAGTGATATTPNIRPVSYTHLRAHET